MTRVPYQFQQDSHTRRSALPLLGIIALSLSDLGCWQEVHYAPGPAVPPTQKVAAAKPESTSRDQSPTPTPERLFEDSEPESVVAAEVVSAPAAEQSAATLPPPEELAAAAEATLAADPSDSLDPVAGEAERESAEAEPAGGELGVPEVRDPSADVTAPARSGLAAWQLGSHWSMAAALQAKGRDVEHYSQQLEQAKVGANLLGVLLPELPTHEAGADRLAENLIFLLDDAGPRLASELQELHGTKHAALAELATKTNVLLLSYTPSSTRLEPVVSAIRQAAESSGLPESVWRELVDLLAARAEFQQVKTAIFQLHQRATAHLSGSS